MKQKAKIFVLLFIIAPVVYLIFLAARESRPPTINQNYQQKSYSRIVSLAPSTTEILFALGLGNKVIGVSQFCNWPPQAKDIPRMGGLMNPNYEAIVAAKPDLVIVFDEMLKPDDKFAALGIETLAVKHNTIHDILDSILLIGQTCGMQDEAGKLIDDLNRRMEYIAQQSQKRAGPRVLICVGHTISDSADKPPENIYIAGSDGFYSVMNSLAGGQNAYTGSIPFPAVSSESVISMNPEIIIDIVLDEQNQIDSQTIIKQWKNFSRIDAVKNDRIYVFSEDYIAIPGPRFMLTLEKIARVINPEIRLEEDERKGN